MKQESPSIKSRSFSGAFCLNKNALERFCELGRAHLGDEVITEFILKDKSGTKYIAENVDEVSKLPIHNLKDRAEFSLRASLAKSVDEIRIEYNYTLINPVYAMCYSKDRVDRIFQDVVSFVDGTRAWYENIRRYRWIAQVAASGLSGVLLAISLGNASKDKVIFYSISLSVILSLMAYFIIGYLFDAISVEFGEEAERLNRKKSIRSWIFVSLFGGTLLAIITAILKKYIG